MNKFHIPLKVSAFALIALPAFAQAQTATPAGTQITNEVSVGYFVNNVSQNPVTAQDKFAVDRKVDFTLVEVGGSATSSTPAQTNAATRFQLTNASNAPLDFQLSVTQLPDGTSLFGTTDNFDVAPITYYRDVNNNGLWDSGDTQIVNGQLDEVAAGASVMILAVGDIASGRVNGDASAIRLTATSHAGGASGTFGAVVTESTANDTNRLVVDTLFASAVRVPQGANPAIGQSSANDAFRVASATLNVTKRSFVLSDPIRGTNNPLMIPGAVVQYCIVVANNGSVSADSVTITDPVPTTNLTLNAGTAFSGGTSTTTSCTAGSTPQTISGSNVTATLGTIAPNASNVVTFTATVK